MRPHGDAREPLARHRFIERRRALLEGISKLDFLTRCVSEDRFTQRLSLADASGCGFEMPFSKLPEPEMLLFKAART